MPADYFNRFCLALDDQMDRSVEDSMVLVSESNKSVHLNSELKHADSTVCAAVDAKEMPSVLALPFTVQELKEAQAADASLSLTNKAVQIGELLFHPKGDTRTPLIPGSMTRKVLHWLHDRHGHQGLEKMKLTADGRVYMMHQDKLFREYLKRCYVCMSSKSTSHGHDPLRPIDVEHANDRWQIDFFVFKQADSPDMHVLNVIDLFSGFTHCRRTANQQSSEVIRVSNELILIFGGTKCISSDNGPHFVSSEFREFCAQKGIQKIDAVPWHPQSNGAVEASNKVLKPLMRGGLSLEEASHVANFVPRASHAVSPATVYLRRPVDCKDALNPLSTVRGEYDTADFEARKKIIQQKYAEIFNAHHRKLAPKIVEDQIIFARNMTSSSKHTPYIGPFQVKSVEQAHVTATNMRTGRTHRIAMNRIKPGHVEQAEPVAEEQPEAKEKPDIDQEYEIESIVDHRMDDDGQVQLSIKWTGYADPTWEPASNIDSVLLAQYFAAR
jgi:transposase InsO family protein